MAETTLNVEINLEKLKERMVRETDFAIINGRIEMTRAGILKVLNEIAKKFKIKTRKEILQYDPQQKAIIIKATLTLIDPDTNQPIHQVEALGSNDMESTRRPDFHALIGTAETRAIKRAVEEIATDIVNQLIFEIFGTFVVEQYGQRQYGGYQRQQFGQRQGQYSGGNYQRQQYQQQPPQQFPQRGGGGQQPQINEDDIII